MPRDRARGRRSNGKSKSNKDDSPLYTGRGSWPIVEWHTKHELSKLGLPGSIVHHKIKPTHTPCSVSAKSPMGLCLHGLRLRTQLFGLLR